MAKEDEDLGVQEANERDIEKVRKAAKESEEPKAKEPEDDGDDDDDVEIDDTDEEPVTRNERRQNRFREVAERAERAERAAEEMRAQYQQLMQQQMQLMQQQATPPQQGKSFEDSYREVEMELIRLRGDYSNRLQQYANAGRDMPQDELASYIDRNRDLEVRKQSLLSDNYIERNNLRPQQVDPRQQQIQMELAVIRAQNADVFQNRVAALHVNYAYQRMLAEGKPDTIQTASAAIEEARRVVLKKGPAGSATQPSQAQKARFTGQSAGGSGPAREQGQPQRIVMTKDMRRMADAALPHIKDDKKRWSTWYKQQHEAGAKSKARQT